MAGVQYPRSVSHLFRTMTPRAKYHSSTCGTNGGGPFIINEEADQIFIMPVNERWIYHRLTINTLESIKTVIQILLQSEPHTGPNQFALWRKVDGSRRYPAVNILHLPRNRCYLPFGLILIWPPVPFFLLINRNESLKTLRRKLMIRTFKLYYVLAF